MSPVRYRRDTATTDDVHAHLTRCDADFTPPLSARLDLADYAAKLADRAARFEGGEGVRLVGLVGAAHAPGPPGAFISNARLFPELRAPGLPGRLGADCIARA